MDRDGHPLNPHTLRRFEPVPDDNDNDEAFKEHLGPMLDQILERVKEDGSAEVTLYFHGALLTRRRARDLAVRLFRAQHECAETAYPIFFLWDASLSRAYGDHLFRMRQGRRTLFWGVPTSPLYLATDLAIGVVKTPLVWGYQVNRAIRSELRLGAFYRNAERKHEALVVDRPNGVRLSDVPRRPPVLSKRGLRRLGLSIVRLVPQLVTTPIVVAFGTPAWKVYVRRTRTAIRRPEEFDARSGDAPNFRGTLSILMTELNARLLAAYRHDLKPLDRVRITAVGHSTGAILVNRLVENFKSNAFERIVYVGAASTVDDFVSTVVVYLKENRKARFFSVSLDMYGEEREANYLGIVPRGSLLEWLDSYLEDAPTLSGRVVGKWANLMAAQHVLQGDARSRSTLKMLPIDDSSYPQKHGELDDDGFDDFHILDAKAWDISTCNECVDGSSVAEGSRAR